MSRARLVRAVAGLLLLGAGLWSCYSPNFVSGVTKCSASGACPDDWVCEAGLCVDKSANGTGGASAAGGQGGGPASGGHGGSGAAGNAATGGSASGSGGAVSSGGAIGTGGIPGSGGKPATGGAPGSGGTPATGGSPGTGGAVGPTCIQGGTTPPPATLITDFSDAVPDTTRPAGDFTFGSTTGFPGGTSRYASGAVGTTTLMSGQLVFTATLEAPTTADMYPFNGFVLFMSSMQCIDASRYTGVSFDLALSGNCLALFEFNDSEHTLASNDGYRGTCPVSTTTCFNSQFSVSSGHNKIPFSGVPFVNGQPTAAVDPRKLIGLQWQFGIPTGSTTACSASLTLDNVSFY